MSNRLERENRERKEFEAKEKALDKYDLLAHLPEHQRKFMIEQHPEYLAKLEKEFEVKRDQVMSTPPGVFNKFSLQQQKQEAQAKFTALIEKDRKKQIDKEKSK